MNKISNESHKVCLNGRVVSETDNVMDKYSSIIDLPHHVSKVRSPMTMCQRAAQFAPFAALTGHSAAISETARLVDKRIELSDSEYEKLNRKVALFLAHLDEHPRMSITYFIPDSYKEGGRYATHSGIIRSWNEYDQRITFDDDTQIMANEIIDINGELFDNAEL